MATYVDILKSEFPEIDAELFDYITGETPGTEPLCAAPVQGHTTGFRRPVSREPRLCSPRANELAPLG